MSLIDRIDQLNPDFDDDQCTYDVWPHFIRVTAKPIGEYIGTVDCNFTKLNPDDPDKKG